VTFIPTFTAVLADIAAVGVGDRYCLGDLVGYAPWPNETLELSCCSARTSRW
jgi:hypothetical protein